MGRRLFSVEDLQRSVRKSIIFCLRGRNIEDVSLIWRAVKPTKHAVQRVGRALTRAVERSGAAVVVDKLAPLVLIDTAGQDAREHGEESKGNRVESRIA